ncbi:MAG: polyphosphate kinase 2, partial [Acidimicrobiia bacterium]|nr:polyphosphate kinase 2 [Acidimicrobiia bacterium]
SDDVQEQRFKDRLANPAKRWKFSDMDVFSRSMWTEYSRAKDIMMEHTSIPESPWWVVDGDDKRRARLNTISHLLTLVPYGPVEYSAIELPEITRDTGYQRPPIDNLNWIPRTF